MDLSILIAKEITVIYIVSGIAVLIGQLNFQKISEDLIKSPALILITGFVGTIVGFILVLYHNIWINSWIVLITIISWLLFIGGVLIIIYPKSLMMMSKFYKQSALWGLLMICFGLLFGYFGFIK